MSEPEPSIDELVDMSRRQSRQYRVNATSFRFADRLTAHAPAAVREAAAALSTPVAAVTLIFAEGAVVVAAVGVEPGRYPLETSYCVHVVEDRDWVAVTSALDDPRVCDKLSTIEGGFRSYLGVPLITPRKRVVGALCVADYEPRDWSPGDVRTLTAVAERLMDAVSIPSDG